MMRIPRAASTALLGAVLAASIGLSAAHAGNRALPDGGNYPHITVTSQYDPTQSVSAPVRRLPKGDQVRLPGGAWVWCGINCYHTLRNATVDFWRRYDAPVTLP
ncbi:MAG TPA: hypothetical protein VMW57_07095 [Methyloceanibacter sp.]|nr:hypothetical protein [Methyloceanibacter sp.]